MNTDGILDFIVEYYIWFIIGGIIIIVAFIGFFSEKKHVLPKRKHEKKGKIKNEEIEQKNNEVSNDSNAVSEVSESELSKTQLIPTIENPHNENDSEQIPNESMENDDKVSNDELIANNEQETFAWPIFDEQLSQSNQIEAQADEQPINNVQYMDEPVQQPVEDFVEVNDNLSTPNTDTDIKVVQDETVDNLSKDDATPSLNNDEQIPDDSIETIVNDIDKIDKMEFSEKDSLDDLKKEPETKNNLEDNLNEKLDDTMQVSYSQLKEMVEDIIAENEQENANKLKSNNDTSIDLSKDNGAMNMPLPHLENTKVDNINDEDDEDGVWKF